MKSFGCSIPAMLVDCGVADVVDEATAVDPAALSSRNTMLAGMAFETSSASPTASDGSGFAAARLASQRMSSGHSPECVRCMVSLPVDAKLQLHAILQN